MLPGNERHDVERGGKIIMPPSALDQLTRLSIVYPMLFKLTNDKMKKVTHCGVLEFVADEGKVYLPHWMMRNLLLDEGSMLIVESTSLPVATFSKFQPQSVDFLDITNPKAVLENALRGFACLTTGDVIAINYNDRVYELFVAETQPKDAVTIIECDMRVDFAPPVGYQEPTRVPLKKPEVPDALLSDGESEDSVESNAAKDFTAFSGSGNRLDGNKQNKKTITGSAAEKAIVVKRGIPDYNYKIGYLKFIRKSPKADNVNAADESQEAKFIAFSGEGQTIRKKK
jgi:ubiquitin fusion degradation protein 1